MSLFKARDWWSTVLGEKEEFDQGCLCLADVDNSGNGQGDEAQAEDLLLEVHLRDPILQVEVGKFVSSCCVAQCPGLEFAV
uniref:Protein PTHB1-like n=1 Tax=Castor canadensis TaxID=51338 RepID=A0A8B7UFM6_CASCN|nr:protein PTHB1-like [Castor canadensis]